MEAVEAAAVGFGGKRRRIKRECRAAEGKREGTGHRVSGRKGERGRGGGEGKGKRKREGCVGDGGGGGGGGGVGFN